MPLILSLEITCQTGVVAKSPTDSINIRLNIIRVKHFAMKSSLLQMHIDYYTDYYTALNSKYQNLSANLAFTFITGR